MTSDQRAKRFKHKIYLIVSFLGFILPETDQKCIIYVIFKKYLPTNLVSFISRTYLPKIVKSTVRNFFSG